MAIAFESLYSDIGGRIGKLTVGKKTVRTPALLPVINPHLQLIPPKEMQNLGVEALITNAYIFSQSRQFRDRALNEGLHRVLDFDGVIMTDSGSFQLSVYGEVSITNTETLSFQRDIGSDIWVPLDIPTSPAADRDTTERDLAITLDRLAEAKEIFGPDAPLAGPVQGGTFTDLRKSSAKRVTELGFSFCPVGAVVPLMEAYRYRDLVRVVMASKETLAPSACVHLFGAGHPSMFALATAMGCDLFDSAAYALYAKDGRYLTAHGSYRIEDLTDLPCSCKVCRSHTAEELRTAKDRERLLSYHNLYATLAEIARVRQAVTDGTLWELVDERCRAHPRLLDGYRELLTYTPILAEHDRVSKRRFFYRGEESCSRTEVMRYQQQIARLPLGPRVLVVIDGKTAEGYSDTLLFKPPFGPYPVELKETFPIGPCEIPDWDDAMVRQGCRGIRALAESHPESTITIACSQRWAGIVHRELNGMEIADDEV